MERLDDRLLSAPHLESSHSSSSAAAHQVTLPGDDKVSIVHCGQPPTVHHATLDNETRADAYGWGQVVTYNCDCEDCGDVTRQATCSEAGRWVVADPRCPGDNGTEVSKIVVVRMGWRDWVL